MVGEGIFYVFKLPGFKKTDIILGVEIQPLVIFKNTLLYNVYYYTYLNY